MGAFDSIYAECPNCRRKSEFQSKSGECMLGKYTLENCPEDVLVNANRHSPNQCECGCWFAIDVNERKTVIFDENFTEDQKFVFAKTEFVKYVKISFINKDMNLTKEEFELLSKKVKDYLHFLISDQEKDHNFIVNDKVCIGKIKVEFN